MNTVRSLRYILYLRSGLSRYRSGTRPSGEIGRAEYVPITDREAVEAFRVSVQDRRDHTCHRKRHAVAYARKLAPKMEKDQIIVVNLSGRGDKDVAAIARYRGVEIGDL